MSKVCFNVVACRLILQDMAQWSKLHRNTNEKLPLKNSCKDFPWDSLDPECREVGNLDLGSLRYFFC